MADFNYLGVSLLSLKAGATIRANRLVYLSAAQTVSETAAITNQVIGVATHAASTGEQVAIQTFGKAKVVAQEAITAGAEIMPDGAGGGKAAPAAGATAVSCGIALEAASADDEVIEVLLYPSVKSPANS